MNKDIYSFFKAAHHQDRIKSLQAGNMILPTQIQLDLTNKCNHACGHCYYVRAKDEIPLARVFTLLEELKENGIPAIQFTGGGEPMLHPEFFNILGKLLSLNMHYALVTNGTLEISKHLNLLLMADWIRVSLDAATPETYSASQGCPEEDFRKATHCIAELARYDKRPILGVSFIINPINYREILKAAQLAKDLEADNFRISLAFSPSGNKEYQSIKNEIISLSSHAQSLETEKFKVTNMVPQAIAFLAQDKKYSSFCGYQYFTGIIGADLEMYPCCTLKYSEIKLGNLAEAGFADIWYGQKRTKWLQSNYLKDICSLHPCGMGIKNAFIEYLISDNPPCVAYI